MERILIGTFLLILSVANFAKAQCSVTSINLKNRSLKKVFIEKQESGKTRVSYLFEKELIKANPFFCYKRQGLEECLGDDDSGLFILKKKTLKIKRLTIRQSDDTFHSIQGNSIAFTQQSIPCSKLPQ